MSASYTVKTDLFLTVRKVFSVTFSLQPRLMGYLV